MAKLSRIHFAGMGNVSARFNPLTLDFRGVDGAPAHTVLWLRNGGGKTTMLSLFYSVLLPSKREWLGKFHDKPTELSHYMFDRELGYILIEFTFADGSRRIVGQSLVKRSAQEVSRICFTLRSDGPVRLESLPVVGLPPETAKTREAFFNFIEEANRKDPRGVEFVKFDLGQRSLPEWERHLVAIGVDPAVYRSHLVMNSDEGGLGEFFDFKTSDRFIEKIIEMADDPLVLPEDQSETDQAEAAVDAFRTKILSLPELDKEARFCQLIADGTQLYRAASLAAAAAAQDLQTARMEAAKALFSVRSALEACDTKMIGFEEHRLKLNGQQREAEAIINTHSKYLTTYQRQAKELRVAEAQSNQVAQKQNEAAQRQDLEHLRCAALLQELDYWIAEVRRRQEELEALLADRRPEITAVANLGTTLWSKFDGHVKQLNTSITEARRQRESNRAESAKLRVLRAELQRKRTDLSTALNTALERLRIAERERRALRETGVIVEGESPTDAASRLIKAIADIDEMIAERGEEVIELRGRARGHRAEAKGHRENAAKEARLASEIRSRLEAAVSLEEQLKLDRVIQKHGGANIDLRNPGLLQAIRTEIEDLDALILAGAVGRAADDRILARHSPPTRPTFPTPLAVEKVLDLLRAKGVRSAIARYDWINANHALGEAENLLRTNPAAAFGILLQDPAEMERAASVVSADGIDIPITITVLSSVPRPTVGHVVIPAERGYFNAGVAVASRGIVQERVNGAKREEDRVRGLRNEAAKAGHSLQEYTAKYTANLLEEWHQDLERREATVASLSGQATTAEGLADATDERANVAQSQIAEYQRKKGELGRQSQQVNKYVTDFHNRIEGWKQTEKNSSTGLQETEQALEAADNRDAVMEDENEKLEQKVVQLTSEIGRWKSRQENIAQQYRNGTVDESVFELDTLEALFRLKRDSLEQALNASGLPNSINVAEDARQRAQRNYDDSILAHHLLAEDVRAARELHGDIKAAIAEQESVAEGSRIALALADHELALAKQEWANEPPLMRDQRSTVHPEWGAANTRAHAEKLVQRCETICNEHTETKERCSTELARLKDETAEVQRLKSALKPWPDQLERACSGVAAKEEHSHFVPQPDIGDVLSTIRSAVDAQVTRHREATEKAGQVFNDRIQNVLTNPDYTGARMEILSRLAELVANRPQFDARIDDILAAINDRISVIEHSQKAVDEERGMVIRTMEARGIAAIQLLRRAQRLSEMPAEIPAWAGHSFMKFSIHEKRDENERRSYLSRLLQYWITSKVAIPRGHSMAFECLMALVGSLDGSGKPHLKGAIGVEILKPEANLRFYYHDILVMRTFSGGELVTAAIILYCVMARLRARQRGADIQTLSKDSGFLLLDNPVGKANLPDFLDLQINIAEVLGVQYICGTGINDFEALGAFPKVVRLRNSAINPRNGASLVQVSKEQANPLSAIQVAAKTAVPARRRVVVA